MKFQLWKLKAIVIGLYILATTKKGSGKTLKGLCCPNAVDDCQWMDQFGSDIHRVNIEHGRSIEMFNYWVLVPSENTPEKIADSIIKFQSLTEENPKFYAIGNENNNLTTDFIRQVRYDIRSKNNKHTMTVVKAAHTSCVEHAGQAIYYEYLTDKRELDLPSLPHLLHFYLKPEWEYAWIENLKRKALFTYIVKSLQNRGYNYMVVDEVHAGSTQKPDYPIHGDFVYCSKKGWEDIYNLCDKLGVTSCHYYHAPFLGYDGNTILNGG